MSETTELIDKNIDRLVEAIKAAGPSAEYGFQETLGYISVQGFAGLGVLLFGFFFSLAVFSAGFWAGAKNDFKDDFGWALMMPSGIMLIVVFIFGSVAFNSLLAKALHPTGYLIMQAIQ